MRDDLTIWRHTLCTMYPAVTFDAVHFILKKHRLKRGWACTCKSFCNQRGENAQVRVWINAFGIGGNVRQKNPVQWCTDLTDFKRFSR